MSWGQLVIGPPGAGKSTYCAGLQQFMNAIGRRVAVVNLDPANDYMNYDCAVDIRNLISVSDAMDAFSLGPNGGLLYCMEFLEANLDWLIDEMKSKQLFTDCYLLFDLPGQVELYTHHQSLPNVIRAFIKRTHCHLIAIHLLDAHCLLEPPNFISGTLLSLSIMCHMELPHLNVLSKIDLFRKSANSSLLNSLSSLKRAENLQDFLKNRLNDKNKLWKKLKKETKSSSVAEQKQLKEIAQRLSFDFYESFHGMHEKICEVISEYNLVSFVTLNIRSKKSVWKLLTTIDKVTAFPFASATEDIRFKLDAVNYATADENEDEQETDEEDEQQHNFNENDEEDEIEEVDIDDDNDEADDQLLQQYRNGLMPDDDEEDDTSPFNSNAHASLEPRSLEIKPTSTVVLGSRPALSSSLHDNPSSYAGVQPSDGAGSSVLVDDAGLLEEIVEK